jgi:hypothetical protein
MICSLITYSMHIGAPGGLGVSSFLCLGVAAVGSVVAAVDPGVAALLAVVVALEFAPVIRISESTVCMYV